jgi:hypothetical protein
VSDMDQSDVKEPEAPAADAAAPAEPEASPEASAVDTAAFDAAVAALPPVTSEDDPEAESPVPATPILAKPASSESPTQAPEVDEDEETLTLEDAARVVIDLVKAHRTIGDSDLAAAIAVLEDEFPAPEPEQDEEA